MPSLDVQLGLHLVIFFLNLQIDGICQFRQVPRISRCLLTHVLGRLLYTDGWSTYQSNIDFYPGRTKSDKFCSMSVTEKSFAYQEQNGRGKNQMNQSFNSDFNPNNAAPTDPPRPIIWYKNKLLTALITPSQTEATCSHRPIC